MIVWAPPTSSRVSSFGPKLIEPSLAAPSLNSSTSWPTWSRIAADTAIVVRGDDDRAPNQEALVIPRATRGGFSPAAAHGRTPSMVSRLAASRGAAASRAAAIDSGRSCTKSPSARR